MSYHSDLDLQLSLVRDAMQEELDLEQIHVESLVHSLVTQADDLVIALNDPRRASYVMENKIAIGQALMRIQLVASSIMAREPRQSTSKLRVLGNA
jgi:hypothetical protein